MQIVITTRRIQNRKHHKRRINKKWAKRYGFTEYEVQEKGKPIIVGGRGQKQIMYVTYEDFMKLKETVQSGQGGQRMSAYRPFSYGKFGIIPDPPEPDEDVIAIEISEDIDKPNKYQTKDGKWHEGMIPTNAERRTNEMS